MFSHAEPDASPQNVDEVPAIDQNGVITVYEIWFVPLETFEGQISTDSVYTSNGSLLLIVLTGLEEYVEYDLV